MAEQFLGPRRGGVDFKIATQSYKTVLTEQEFESNVGQDDVTTFNDEPDTAFEEGQSLQRFRGAGRMKDGSAASGPMMPASLQGVALTQIWGGSNTLSGIANWSRNLMRRTVQQVGVFAFEGIYVGPVVKSWNVGP